MQYLQMYRPTTFDVIDQNLLVTNPERQLKRSNRIFHSKTGELLEFLQRHFQKFVLWDSFEHACVNTGLILIIPSSYWPHGLCGWLLIDHLGPIPMPPLRFYQNMQSWVKFCLRQNERFSCFNVVNQPCRWLQSMGYQSAYVCSPPQYTFIDVSRFRDFRCQHSMWFRQLI